MMALRKNVILRRRKAAVSKDAWRADTANPDFSQRSRTVAGVYFVPARGLLRTCDGGSFRMTGRIA